MTKRLQGILIGFLIASIITSGTVFASQATKKLTVTYRDIKLSTDGKEFIPRDASGNIVEPFIYNGTTYLPVRAVGEALGRQVLWDGATSTVRISGKPEKEIYIATKFKDITKNNSAFTTEFKDDDSFVVCTLSLASSSVDFSGRFDFERSFTYSLGGTVSKFSGTLVPPECTGAYSGSFRLVLTDENGKTLFESDYVSSSSSAKELPFEVSTEGCQKLTVKFEGQTTATYPYKCICKIKNPIIYTTDY